MSEGLPAESICLPGIASWAEGFHSFAVGLTEEEVVSQFGDRFGVTAARAEPMPRREGLRANDEECEK